MELAWFIPAFDRAAALCRRFAQEFVVEELPSSLRFDFSAAGRPTDTLGRVEFLGGRLLLPVQLRCVEADHTYVEVRVTDRLVVELAQMYHRGEGNPPFHILGPALPPGWVSLTESGRFSLGR